MLVLSIIVLQVVISVQGHRYGADPMACDSMKPGHGANRRQTRATPFIIDTNLDGYVPCSTVGQRDCGVVVRIRSRRFRFPTMFKGFLLQARSRSPNGQITYVGEYRYMTGQQVTARNNQMNQMRTAGQFGANPMGFQGMNGAMGAGMGGMSGMTGMGGMGGMVKREAPNDTVDPTTQDAMPLDPTTPLEEAPVALPQVGVPPGQFNPNMNPNNPFNNQMGVMGQQ